MNEDDINRKFEVLVRRGVFKSVSRYIGTDSEERLQEGIAQVFELYKRHALAGRELDVAVLVCACRRRATDLSRHLVRAQHSLKDPLDPRAFHQGRVELVHLDGQPDREGERGSDGDPDLEATIFDSQTASRVSALISAISLGEWLERLTAMDLMLVTRRLEGYTLAEISGELGKSITVTCQRLQQLGQDLAQHARLPVPRRNRKARGSTVPLRMAAA